MTDLKTYNSLWVEKYRPKALEDLALSPDIRADILKYKEAGELPHLLLYGDPGCGKTTLAQILVNEVLDCQYMYINASDENGVDTVRGKIKDFAETKSIDGKLKVIILDEVDGFSSTGGGGSSAQQALRNVMEEYAFNVRFILTCNFMNKLIGPLISRCVSYKIDPPLKAFVNRCAMIFKMENVKIENPKEFVDYVTKSYPDMRLAINCMQRDSLTGKFVPKTVQKTPQIVFDVFKHLVDGEDPIALRRIIIERASEFGSNYETLMHDLFNVTYDSDIGVDRKREFMTELASGMYKHQLVMDKEVNCYATFLKMCK